jgi:hypothetical protein
MTSPVGMCCFVAKPVAAANYFRASFQSLKASLVVPGHLVAGLIRFLSGKILSFFGFGTVLGIIFTT